MATTVRAPLPRGLLILLGAAASVVVLAGLRAVGHLVGPVFLALVLTLLVHPARGWLERRRVPRWAASTICVLTVYSLLLGLTAALAVATGRFATLLPSYQDRLNSLVDDALAWLEDIGVGQSQVQAVLDSLDFSKLSDLVTGVLGGAVGLVSSLVFICTLVLFMTMDAGTFPALLALTARERPGLAESLGSFASGTRTYLLVSTVFGLIVAVLDSVALAALGVPVPVLWGLLSFITNYIPNIGFVIGLVPPAVLGLLEGGPGLMLAVIVVYSLINLVLQSIVQPKFVGDAVGLSTSITFLSLVFWAFVLGPLGALLAVPLTLLVKAVLVDADPGNTWLAAAAVQPRSGRGRSQGCAAGPRPGTGADPGLVLTVRRAASVGDGDHLDDGEPHRAEEVEHSLQFLLVVHVAGQGGLRPVRLGPQPGELAGQLVAELRVHADQDLGHREAVRSVGAPTVAVPGDDLRHRNRARLAGPAAARRKAGRRTLAPWHLRVISTKAPPPMSCCAGLVPSGPP